MSSTENNTIQRHRVRNNPTLMNIDNNNQRVEETKTPTQTPAVDERATNENTIYQALVDDRHTINPTTTNELVNGRDTINQPPQSTVNGSFTQNKPPTNNRVNGRYTLNIPPQPTARQQRRRQRKRRGPKIRPCPVPSIPPARPQLQRAQDNNFNDLVGRMANLDLDKYEGTFGDEMTTDESWPNPGERDYLRIFLINANGISYYNNYLDWEMNMGFLFDMQVDVFGITEPNLDFAQAKVCYDVSNKTRMVDKFMDLNFSASKFNSKVPTKRTPFKMGGTITGVNGGWSGRKQQSGTDKLQRWTWTSLTGQGGKLVTFITFYRPCVSNSDGESTIHMQQIRDLLAEGKTHPDPRREMLNDLEEFVTTLHEGQQTVFLMGDMNADVQNDEEIATFLDNCGLQNVMTTRHGDTTKLPPSYDRGDRCIDIMATSKTTPKAAIKKCGILPFYFNFATDHRGFFCDISTEWLFSRTKADITRPIMRRFTTSRVPRCNLYLNNLEALMENAQLLRSVNQLRDEINNLPQHECEHNNNQKLIIISRCKNLFNTMTGYMKRAERKCGKLHYPDGYPFSHELRQSAERIFQVKKRIRILSINNYQDDEDLLIQAKQDLIQAYQHLRKTQQNSAALRQHCLDELKDKRAEEWQMEPVEALQIIQASEKSRSKHAKHKKYMKKQMGGAIRRLLVPAPNTGNTNNIRDPAQNYMVEDPAQIFEILLRRNFTQLQRSKNSIFSTGTFSDHLGHHGENKEFFDSLLNGTVDPTAYDDEYPQFKGELSHFITALSTKVKDGDPTFQWEYGAKEFTTTFRKTRESTACGPSSLHMSHYRAATERQHIASVHAFFIWAAFKLGFSYDRWEVSWHCMLQKMKEPYVDKLRIIQLFEGDFNGGLKYFLGRLLMQHITKQQYVDKETYGSRMGKSAPEALITLQTLFAHCATWNITVSMMFNDAAGCFDRIPLVLAELAAVGSGCDRSMMRCHTETQKRMKHYVRTAAGVSEGFIQFNATTMITLLTLGLTIFHGLIGGIGQGGGGGPILWLMVSVIMIEALRKLCTGATMEHVLGWFTYTLWLVSYVDDNTLLKTFSLGATPDVVFTDMRKMMKHWHRLLQITGGDLCLDKCKVSVLSWNTNNYWGIPRPSTITQFPGEVTMTSDLDPHKEIVVLERIEPHVGERILGVRLPIMGPMKEELKYRIDQMKTMANDLQRHPLIRSTHGWFMSLDIEQQYDTHYQSQCSVRRNAI